MNLFSCPHPLSSFRSRSSILAGLLQLILSIWLYLAAVFFEVVSYPDASLLPSGLECCFLQSWLSDWVTSLRGHLDI